MVDDDRYGGFIEPTFSDSGGGGLDFNRGIDSVGNSKLAEQPFWKFLSIILILAFGGTLWFILTTTENVSKDKTAEIELWRGLYLTSFVECQQRVDSIKRNHELQYLEFRYKTQDDTKKIMKNE